MKNTPLKTPLELYMGDIGKFDRLTQEGVSELSTIIAQADWDGSYLEIGPEQLRARNELASRNLPLVISIARKFTGKGLSLPDLIQEGNIGLLRATEMYDPRESKFATYAKFWIKQSIKKALTDSNGDVRQPAYVYQLTKEWNNAVALLDATATDEAICGKIYQMRIESREAELERINKILDLEPQEEFVSAFNKWKSRLIKKQEQLEKALSVDGRENLKVTPHKLKTIKIALTLNEAQRERHLSSIDQDIQSERSKPEHSLEALTTPHESLRVEAQERLTVIRDFMETLDLIEKTILNSRFELDGSEKRTLKEIGLEFGMGAERIRQIQVKLLERLRMRLNNAGCGED